MMNPFLHSGRRMNDEVIEAFIHSDRRRMVEILIVVINI
jgi:hypothetical protein